MKSYRVELQELHIFWINVDAENETEARELAEEKLIDEMIEPSRVEGITIESCEEVE